MTVCEKDVSEKGRWCKWAERLLYSTGTSSLVNKPLLDTTCALGTLSACTCMKWSVNMIIIGRIYTCMIAKESTAMNANILIAKSRPRFRSQLFLTSTVSFSAYERPSSK